MKAVRAFVQFYGWSLPIAVAGVIVMVGVGWAVGSSVADNTVRAYVAPRPTVELVKVFQCDLLYSRAGKCASDVESQANEWMQQKQPGIRIVNRALAASKDGIFLVIFYEVPEWRTKLPAEAPPR